MPNLDLVHHPSAHMSILVVVALSKVPESLQLEVQVQKVDDDGLL